MVADLETSSCKTNPTWNCARFERDGLDPPFAGRGFFHPKHVTIAARSSNRQQIWQRFGNPFAKKSSDQGWHDSVEPYECGNRPLSNLTLGD
jgi:hypothetical protein